MPPDGAADRNFSKGGSLTNNGKIEYKKIPVPKQAQELIE